MNLKFTTLKTRNLIFKLVILALVVGPMGLPQAAFAIQESEQTTKVSVGIGGQIRLGKWTPLLIESSDSPVRFEVEVLDGDDTPIIYGSQLVADENRPGHFQAWARLGRVYGKAQLRLFNAGDELILDQRLDLRGENKVGMIHESTHPIFVTIEPESSIEEQIRSLSVISGGENTRVVTNLGKGDDLPLNSLGYDGVESVFITTSDSDRISDLSPKHMDALETWVRHGGKLVLSAASSGDKLLAEGCLFERFTPGKYLGSGTISNSSRLESLSTNREQLISNRNETMAVSTFDNVEGVIALSDGKSTPLIIRKAMGLGQVVFVAFDLDSPRIANWKGFADLISFLLDSEQKARDDEGNGQSSSQGSSVSHFGYNDLIGQLRVPMETFSKVRFVAFTLIALLIGLYILCIGPGDYFFLSRVLKKMELTWITFPLLSLLFCGLAFWIASITRPSEIQMNQIEILDVDAVSGRTRGTIWANIYSPKSESYEIELDSKNDLGFDIDSELLSWHGLPGDGLGGMFTKANPGLLKTSYRQDFELSENGRLRSKLVDVPLQNSSTKPIFVQWWADNPVRIRSRLKKDRRLGGQIIGTVTNPFDFTLNKCKLVFENWAYVLDQPLEPGQTFDVQTESREKTLKSLLTRKVMDTEKKNRGSASPWDAEDTRIRRIMDMMMFYKAAGGSRYTGLTHSYQPFVDMSDQVNLERAVLVAEVNSIGSALKLNGDRAKDEYDTTVTIIRIVLPVEYSYQKKSR